MSVSTGDAKARADYDDPTVPEGLRSRSVSPSVSPSAGAGFGHEILPTEVGLSAAAAGPAPAAMSPSGVFRALPGVDRSVTGVYIPAGDGQAEREWYAAFGGRARGPYTRGELELLARRGRVRSSTLVWKPGFDGWKRIRGEEEEHPDLDWLRNVVVRRKRREGKAARKAHTEHGIHRLQLQQSDVSGEGEPLRSSAKLSTGPQLRRPIAPPTPPPTPDEDTHDRPVMFVGRRMPRFAADRVFGVPDLGSPMVREETVRRIRRRHHAKAFAAGVLWAALGLIFAAYTLPTLGTSPAELVERAFPTTPDADR
jgi:hypothetical protein